MLKKSALLNGQDAEKSILLEPEMLKRSVLLKGTVSTVP